MKRFLLMVLLLPFGLTAAAGEGDLQTAADWMTGSFSSAAQAAEDPDYVHITLEMARIWPAREDGYWLYVEQAVAATKDQPYRQRVYHLTERPDGLFESAVFLIESPERVIGAWRSKAPLEDLSASDLIPREGCSVFLRRAGGDRFEGATRGKECASDLRGAAYATSEVVIEADRLESWDRGFDAQDRQVWGAEKGPYRFLRD